MAPDSKVMAVLKADAYGNGMTRVASAISSCVDYYAVAYANEGVSLREITRLTPILVLVYNEEDVLKCEQYNLDIPVSSLRDARRIVYLVDGKCIRIQLAVNTGMNRYGCSSIDELSAIINYINTIPNIEISGIFSHLYDDKIEDNIRQTRIFDEFVLRANHLCRRHIPTHIAASNTVMNIENKYDCIRLGVGMYVGNKANIVDAVSLYSTIQSIRLVKCGEYVGYSCNYRAKCDIIVAVVFGGYADGLSRRMTGLRVFVNNEPAEIIGNVCMDVFFIDVTNIDAKVGDTVEIIGEHNTIDSVASHIGCISYELLTNLNGRTTRSYLE